MYTEEEWQKVKRDYSQDKHELLPEDQAHIDSIKEEIKLSRLSVGM